MAHTIIRGGAQFKYGFAVPAQLLEWMESKETIIGMGVVGRSNVGKSSLINSLYGNKTARVSKTPGRTRQVNVFEFKLSDYDAPFYLFDLPGYGHAKISKEMARNWDELMTTFFEKSLEKNILMINLQDARHPNQQADKDFHKFLAHYDFTTTLAFNKIDKLKRQKDRAVLQKQTPALLKEYSWVKDIHYISAERGDGLDALEQSLINFLLENHQIKKC